MRIPRAHVWLVAVAALAAGSGARVPPAEARAPTTKRPPTPVLVERDVDRGRIDRAAADLYLARAFSEPDRVPARYRSDAPWEGTLWLLELRERLAGMPPGPDRAAIRAALSPTDNCDALTGPNTADSDHFHVHYTTVGGGLAIGDYQAALETTWNTEVTAFGWAAPPPWPGSKYLVVVAPLGPALFGFVGSTGSVGDNPNTAGWNEGDAEASCMVLNSDFSTFPPSTAQQALEATAAHEFNHSIQFGYGALAGPNVPDGVFIEGGATWMEDEVFDTSNDNYNYLWPNFHNDMGEYEDTLLDSPYEYWIAWRGITEPYGTGNAGGGERIMQRFWELTSRNEADSLDALERSLNPENATLAGAYHAYAIAVKFNRPCGGGYVYPYCLEEGPAYVAARGPTAAHGSISGIGAGVSGSLPDNYSLNWVTLPTGVGAFQVRLKNTSSGGKLRATVACDTGSQIALKDFPSQAGPGETVRVRQVDTAGCTDVVAVVTNVSQTAPNPSSSAGRSYQLSLAPPPKPTKTTLKVRVEEDTIMARGRLRPRHRGERMNVTLYERDGKKLDRVDTDRPRLRGGDRYGTNFDRPDADRCRVTARFKGDDDHLPSQKSRNLAC